MPELSEKAVELISLAAGSLRDAVGATSEGAGLHEAATRSTPNLRSIARLLDLIGKTATTLEQFRDLPRSVGMSAEGFCVQFTLLMDWIRASGKRSLSLDDSTDRKLPHGLTINFVMTVVQPSLPFFQQIKNTERYKVTPTAVKLYRTLLAYEGDNAKIHVLAKELFGELVFYDPYCHCTGKRGREFRKLLETTVPDRGPAPTLQGEVVRAVAKLAREYYQNAFSNWGEYYWRFVPFLRGQLCKAGTFEAGQIQEIRQDLKRIGEMGRDQHLRMNEADAAIFARLSDRAVEWCEAHPKKIPFRQSRYARRLEGG